MASENRPRQARQSPHSASACERLHKKMLGKSVDGKAGLVGPAFVLCITLRGSD